MDTHDIFRQLTFGVNFKSNKNNFNKLAKPKDVKETNDIKFENNGLVVKFEEISDYEGALGPSFGMSDTEIKEEIKSEDEDDNEGANLFSNICDTSARKKTTKVLPEKTVKQLRIEEINHFRNVNNIHVSGKNAPAPIESFKQLQEKFHMSKKLVDNIKKCGYETPTPIQMQTIPAMILGRPISACAPTGSGKTAAFLIPIIRDLKSPQNKGFRALIVCPTRELAKQTQRECLRISETLDFRVHIISKVNQAEMKYGSNSSKKYDVLITTPNRICYLINQEPPQLDLSNVQWLVLDEADKLFETGVNSFREQFNQIYKACTSVNKKIALFSATHTTNVAKWCKQNFKNILSITIGHKNAATDLVDQELLFVGSESGKLLAFRELVQNGLQPPVLVFVQSKDRAQQLFNELLYDGINVDVIHADRTQQQRDNVIKTFREGKIWILICTELMSRGIDFKGVNLVINYDFPPSKISYIHRIGRTGRAGRKGRAITFFTQDDAPNVRAIANIMKDSGCIVPEYMLAMKKLTKRTRRRMEKKAPLRDPIATQPEYITKFRKEHKIDVSYKDSNKKFKRHKRDRSGNDEPLSKKKTKNVITTEI